MRNKTAWGIVLALVLSASLSVSVLAADTDLSANYTAAAAIYESAKNDIAAASGKQAEIVKHLDRASTFLASDRRALLSADGYSVPVGAPAALKENRQALADLIAADGYAFTDYLKTLTVRIPQNYGMDYGTFNVARTTLQDALSAGFTDIVFRNDLFSVRLSLVEYLPQVPTTVTTLKYFVGETRINVPQAALDIAQSMPVLAFREYRDGVAVTGSRYTKNAVSLIVNSAMYSIPGKLSSQNLFYRFDEVNETASLVSGYLYSTTSQTASFAVGEGHYFLLLPREAPAEEYEFAGDGYGVYDVKMADDTFTAELFFEETCAGGSAVVYLAFYDADGDVTQVKESAVTLGLGQVSLIFELDQMNDGNFDLFIWRSTETARPLFGKITGSVQKTVKDVE